MARPTPWELGTHDSTVTAIAACLRPLGGLNLEMYSSTDMKTGIDNDNLQDHKRMLLALFGSDARGGYFAPKALHEAVGVALSEKRDEFALECTNANLPYNEGVSTVAYFIKVMISHIRLKFDSSQDGHISEFSEYYDILKEGSKVLQSSARKTRRKSGSQARCVHS